jgi:3-oxoacyl-(acyl-carrier-protein) reductase
MATAVFSELKVSFSKQLEGKVAFVTGASRGIGKAIAKELADRGATVAINFRNNIGSAELVREDILECGGDCVLFQGDVSDKQQARKLIKDVRDVYQRIDILVNNAGITRDRSIRKMTDDDWCDVIETNLNSVFYCTSAAIPAMIDQKFGRIVNIASFSGQAGNFGQANYAASKGGIISLTKVLALELAKFNITANVVSPGFTCTDMTAAMPPDVAEQIKLKIPLRRFARPEEIAKAAAFLICDGDYITGQQINVNGGLYM